MSALFSEDDSFSSYLSSEEHGLQSLRKLEHITETSVSASAGMHFGQITNTYNSQFSGIMNTLMQRRQELNDMVAKELPSDPLYRESRTKGVKLAWKYEKVDIEMGGKGSAKWNEKERCEIVASGKVEGAEGHHQKNVADHPESQANPDNVKFYKSRKEHLEKGHKGNWRNESDADFIDKNKMLKKTNTKRILKNEIKGAGLSLLAGFGIGFSLSAVIELAKVGIDAADVDVMLSHSLSAGLETGAISAVSYGGGRLTANALQSVGVQLESNIGRLLNFASAGALSIVLASTYMIVKYKMQGVETGLVIRAVGKQAMFSFSVLTVSIISQGIYGGCAGIIVSTTIGLLFFAKELFTSIHQRKFEEKLRVFAIEQYKPLLLCQKLLVAEF